MSTTRAGTGDQMSPRPGDVGVQEGDSDEVFLRGNRLRDDKARAMAGRYGIPVNRQFFATCGQEVENAVREVASDSVALKLVADDVVHKSKAGGVLLDVPMESAAARAEELLASWRRHGIDVHGVTVEAMIPFGTEVVLGGFVDRHYGPVVMVGSGGIHVEAADDVAFALAPVALEQARRVLATTRVGRSLRDRCPRQFDRLAELVVAVGGRTGLLLEEPVAEVDINPLVVSADQLIAVDTRAILHEDADSPPEPPDPTTCHAAIQPAIYPSSVAVLGASADPRKLGYRAVRNLLDFGFPGRIIPVNHSGAEVCGLHSVRSVDELEDGVDRAVVVLPARAVPDALRQLARSQVRSAHVYTADVSLPVSDIRDSDMRVLGPNCIGHYSPSAGVTMISAGASPTVAGRIGVVSQSGTYAGDVVRRGQALGIGYSFVTSVGDCHDVRPSELLAFAEADERTDVVACYLEDDTDAGSFFQVARRMTKPVILFKGGRSRAGAAAATSHTGAMASDARLLHHAARQSGVLLVDSLDELLDLLLALHHIPAVVGDGLGLLGSGGGVAVVGTDRADYSGLHLPQVTASTASALDVFSAPGSSLQNPIDIPIWSLFGEDGSYTGGLVRTLAADPGVAALCAYLDLGTVYDLLSGEEAETLVRDLTSDVLRASRGGKPLALVLRSGMDSVQDHLVRTLRAEAADHHVPTFDSVDRAITALGNVRKLSRPADPVRTSADDGHTTV